MATRQGLLRSGTALIVLAFIGCGSGSSACSVTGKITTKGKPVCGGQISVLAADGRIASGGIDGEGNYTIVEAPTGVLKVAVISEKPTAPAKPIKVDPAAPLPPAQPELTNWVPVDPKYGDVNTSGKQMTLKSGSNVVNIELE